MPSTAIDVTFSTSDLSAQAGLDYTAVAGTSVIPITTGSTTVDIPLLDDPDNEPIESFELTLTSVVKGSSQMESELVPLPTMTLIL